MPATVNNNYPKKELYKTQGNIGFVLHNMSGGAVIGEGTRIGQVKFIEAQSADMYTGEYNTAVGEHWSEGENDGNS